MNQDRDIRRSKVMWRCIAIVNLVALVINASDRNWAIAFACAVWLCNVVLMLRSMKIQQETRDMGRVIEAGLHKMRREIETNWRDTR
jgi:hypothetical protein